MKTISTLFISLISGFLSYAQVDSASEIKSVNLKVNFVSPANGGTYFSDSIPVVLSVTNLGPDDLEEGDTIAWRIDQLLPPNTYTAFHLNSPLRKDGTIEILNTVVPGEVGSIQLCAHIIPDRRVFGNLRFTWLDSDTSNNRQCNTFTMEERGPTSLIIAAEEVVKIIPNPAQSKININLAQLQNGKYQVSLIDMFGRTVYQEERNDNSNLILPIQSYPRGIYNLLISGMDVSILKKVVFN